MTDWDWELFEGMTLSEEVAERVRLFGEIGTWCDHHKPLFDTCVGGVKYAYYEPGF